MVDPAESFFEFTLDKISIAFIGKFYHQRDDIFCWNPPVPIEEETQLVEIWRDDKMFALNDKRHENFFILECPLAFARDAKDRVDEQFRLHINPRV